MMADEKEKIVNDSKPEQKEPKERKIKEVEPMIKVPAQEVNVKPAPEKMIGKKDDNRELKAKIRKLQKEIRDLKEENEALILNEKELRNYIEVQQQNVISNLYNDKTAAEKKLKDFAGEVSITLDSMENLLSLSRHAFQHTLNQKAPKLPTQKPVGE